MPMDFPDMQSLIEAAQVHKFRDPIEGESEENYRHALANHVQKIDLVESMEIRAKVGWDKFGERDNTEMLMRAMMRK